MIQLISDAQLFLAGLMLADRELFLLIIGSVTYVALFVMAIQNSRRKIFQLRERLDKIKQMQELQRASDEQSIEANRRKIAELENLLEKMGNENSLLKLELEEKKAKLDYTNTVAMIENEKRQQAETVIFSSAVYLRMRRYLNEGKGMTEHDWSELSEVVNSVYTNFTEKLYTLYKMTDQDYHVSLLVKVRMSPKDIAFLTVHSKESVASTRSRLYSKIFGKKGSTKDWDDFVLSL